MTWGSTEDPGPSDDGGGVFAVVMLVYFAVFVVLPIVCSAQ